MGLFKKFVSQTRKPEGALGKIMLRGMNSGHAKVADWGMGHLHGISPEEILEIGCGGGRNAGELLRRYPKCSVTAVDYSELSVAKAAEYNKKAIEEGRCNVQQANAASLPFADGHFDMATAFETIYFWPGLEKCFTEVARVLKDGGTFLIVNEADGSDAASQKYEKIIDGMRTYSPQQIETALKSAGFREAVTDRFGSKPWITVKAKK